MIWKLRYDSFWPTVPKRPRQPASSSNVDDFVPEGEVDSKFFGREDGEEEEEEEEEDSEEEERLRVLV